MLSKEKLWFLMSIVCCILISYLSTLLGGYSSFLGDVTISILLGMALGNTILHSKKLHKGFSFVEKKVLPFGIGLLGATLHLSTLKELGLSMIAIIFTLMIATIAMAVFIGKIFKVSKEEAILIGSGNAVCGSSAVAATSNVLPVNENQVGVSVACVNLMGAILMIALPYIALDFLNFGPDRANILSGMTLQSVGQVAAASTMIGQMTETSSTLAVVTKMVRVLFLGVIVFILNFIFKNQKNNNNNNSFGNGEKREESRGVVSIITKVKSFVPLFIIGFFALSLLNTLGVLSEPVVKKIDFISDKLILLAMAAIGLGIKFKTLIKEAPKAFSLCFLTSVLQVTLAVIFILTFNLGR